ncbi:hypothetical protein [Peptoniphilus sp. BV3C26]|uniref:hypothetical protein n=1 Tax=Peptoniphilus sp. BV3C26 TaxID=1111134 RepID=UPI0003B8E2F8|nr:hypothetical protein [Peptoniphilus sp. BV3C26]ERT62240.1 hypothetical protein HMPREF1253_1181 [Peptoniphilus sp. BV3C26]
MTVEDNSNVDKILRVLEELSSTAVRIGILSSAEGEILMIANVHEYGCDIPVTDKMRGYFRGAFGINIKKDTTKIRIPERSFIRSSYDENKGKFRTFDDYLNAVLDMKISVQDFYQIIGNACVNTIKEYIRRGDFEPDSSLTLERKKPKTKPLIDTGRLINAIDYEVIKT